MLGSRSSVPLSLSIVAFVIGAVAHPAAAEPTDSPRPRVVGGEPVPPGMWRDTAAIVIGGDVLCTGVLIAPTFVATAGDCIGDDLEAVILDTHTLNNAGERIDVVRAVAYPAWETTYNIALIELAQESRVPPRILSHECARAFIANDAPVTIVGYGAIDNDGNTYVQELIAGDTVIADATCGSVERGCNQALQPDGELGAGGMGVDSCYGDSGGPLYLRTQSGDFLVGLTARGYVGNTEVCSQGGIYTRLDSETVQAWLESEIGARLPASTCGLPPDPRSQTVVVDPGDSVTVEIDPRDPDPDNTHVLSMGTEPKHGTLAFIEGVTSVEYTPDENYNGDDSFTVIVTDDDVPQHSAEALVTVSVGASGCGCRSGAPVEQSWLVFAVVFALAIRSRRAKVRRL